MKFLFCMIVVLQEQTASVKAGAGLSIDFLDAGRLKSASFRDDDDDDGAVATAKKGRKQLLPGSDREEEGSSRAFEGSTASSSSSSSGRSSPLPPWHQNHGEHFHGDADAGRGEKRAPLLRSAHSRKRIPGDHNPLSDMYV
jgi:hypothetical protein